MSNYQLHPNEYIILKNDRINYRDELILTNLNIILIKGVFKSIKNSQYFPVNQIKVFNGKAQVIVYRDNRLRQLLEVYFLNGQEQFVFESKKEAEKWAYAINQLLTGNINEIDTTNNKVIPGTEYIAEVLKDSVDAIKGVFGIKSKYQSNIGQEKVIKKCISCGAQISGNQGQIVQCQYCNTEQQL